MKTKLPEMELQNLSSTLHQCQQKRISCGTKKKAKNLKQRKQFFHRNPSHTHTSVINKLKKRNGSPQVIQIQNSRAN